MRLFVALTIAVCGGYGWQAASDAAGGGAEAAPVARPGFTLSLERLGVSEAPAFVLSRSMAAEERRPAVILVHGGGMIDPLAAPGMPYKEEWFRPVYEETPYRLAAKGILVVAVDMPWAESRATPEMLHRVSERPLEGIFAGYLAGAEEIPQMIEAIARRPDVDPSRIAIAGKSGGALTCLMAACRTPRPAAVVSWKGGAGFLEMTRLRGQAGQLDTAIEQNPAFFEALERADPINGYEKIPPAAVALINNWDDPLMPRDGAETLHAKLAPLYTDMPDRLMLKFCMTNKPTHDDQIEAFESGCAWLEKHLLSAEQAAR